MVGDENRRGGEDYRQILLRKLQEIAVRAQKPADPGPEQQRRNHAHSAQDHPGGQHLLKELVGAVHIVRAQLLSNQHTAAHPQRQSEQGVGQVHRRRQIGHSQTAAANDIAPHHGVHNGGYRHAQGGTHAPEQEIPIGALCKFSLHTHLCLLRLDCIRAQGSKKQTTVRVSRSLPSSAALKVT